jgi:phosphate transport system permease protein
MANSLVGSTILISLASLIGVPWGIGVGVYLSEYSRGNIAKTLRFTTDLLTSVPSIIIGLFIYSVIVKPLKGFSAYAGGAALAVIMIPFVARSTEEVLKLVPQHIREAGLALGLPRWKVILWVVLKGSRAGVITGIMLALARVAGETAPLLVTAFNNRFWSHSLNQPTASLPVQIFTYAISPYDEWHRQAWAGAFMLVMFIFGINLITRFIFSRSR